MSSNGKMAASQDQEYAADLLGAKLMMSAMSRENPSNIEFLYCGADFYFSAISVMERAMGTAIRDYRGYSHPWSRNRRTRLRNSLPEILHGRVPRGREEDFSEKVMEIAGYMQNVTEFLMWTYGYPVVLEAVKSGDLAPGTGWGKADPDFRPEWLR